MKRVAVLHAQIAFERGGAELMVEQLVDELRKRNYEAELISMPFRWYPQNGLYNNLLMWRMLDLKEVNGIPIDLVIPTKFPTYGVIHPNKVLWLMHQHRAAYDLFLNKEHFGLGTINNGEEMRKVILNYDNLTIPESKQIFSISQNVAERLYENNGIKATPLYHPPIFSNQYHCNKYDNYILSVGRLDPLKRTHLLIEALSKSNSNIRVIIVGSGPEEKTLKILVNKYKLHNRVEFTGYISQQQLFNLYSNASAIYFAPIDEDYGYITLEAFLSRKPVITCTDSGGVLEFANENNSYICSPSSESIRIAIDNLSTNTDRLAQLGAAGYDIASQISWDNVIDNLTRTL